jgi:hypothetical protein
VPAIEVRAIRCLDCTGLDLKAHPEQAKGGAGKCLRGGQPGFVWCEMSRNCAEFDPAAPAIVAAREAWAEKLPPRWTR